MRRFRFHCLTLTACGALLAIALPAANVSAPPPLPQVKWHHLSPVEYFRALLSMSPAEREKALARKSPTDRAVLIAKVKEYEAMPRGIREARLCQTELHWALSALMKLRPAERSRPLEEVSVLYRPMVEAILQQWDKIPGDTQQTLLKQENFVGTYLRMLGNQSGLPQKIIDNRHSLWTKNIGSAELEKTVRSFDRLPAPQRAQCVTSFQKFAGMSQVERTQFLKNAARWDAMTSHERQLWREMVRTLPPEPPGFSTNFPPMPPGFKLSPPAPPMPPNVTSPVVVARSGGG